MASWPVELRRRDCKAACLGISGIFLIVGTGCMQLFDLPRTPDVSAVTEVTAGEEAGNKKYQIDAAPVPRKARPNPVRRSYDRQERVELFRPQPLTTGREGVMKEDLQAGASVSMGGEAHARTKSMPPIMAQVTGKSIEKEGTSLFLSEAVIFLVVGAVFLLVHLSMRRRLKAPSNTRLAKLLHTRPWR
jgi:hypothetical protein